MSFWTEASLEPKRAFRFRIKSDNGLNLSKSRGKQDPFWWNAKTVTKPSYSVSSNEYQLINQKFKVPGIVTWEPVNITMASVGRTAEAFIREIRNLGWNPDGLDDGVAKQSKNATTSMGKIRIQQIDGAGIPIETWLLEGAFISRVSFGTLDYSSDDIVEVQITVDYDYAILE